MHFYSTNHKAPKVTFREALLIGQAPDRGLYMPVNIPKIPFDVISSFADLPYPKIAQTVASYIVENDIPPEILEQITKDAYTYAVPLDQIYGNKYVMRLDQGPTASFKDFAARMMARIIQYFLKQDNKKLVILTATSGDTGGAVADAFYHLENIRVVVLYPEKEISAPQRKQMTTLGDNVIAIGVNGKFDDCQALVKEAFADQELSKIPLSSANSINFGRLLPQSVYYFYAYSRLIPKNNAEIIFSVPSGNFGDLMGGLLAKKMGLPVNKFIAAVNENDEFPRFLSSGLYNKIVPSKNCLSSAMNVGHPSNLARLVDIYGGHMDEKGNLIKAPNMEELKRDIWSISISDEETRKTIKSVYDTYKFILEPHGAVGWAGLQAYLKQYPSELPCVSFETADPAKFPEQIQEMIHITPSLPNQMQLQATKKEYMISLSVHYSDFKSFLKKEFL